MAFVEFGLWIEKKKEKKKLVRNGNLLLEPAGYLNYTHLTLKATKKEYRSNSLKYWVEIM